MNARNCIQFIAPFHLKLHFGLVNKQLKRNLFCGLFQLLFHMEQVSSVHLVSEGKIGCFNVTFMPPIWKCIWVLTKSQNCITPFNFLPFACWILKKLCVIEMKWMQKLFSIINIPTQCFVQPRSVPTEAPMLLVVGTVSLWHSSQRVAERSRTRRVVYWQWQRWDL